MNSLDTCIVHVVRLGFQSFTKSVACKMSEHDLMAARHMYNAILCRYRALNTFSDLIVKVMD